MSEIEPKTAIEVTGTPPPEPSRAIVTQVIPREVGASLVPRSYAELEQVAIRLGESGLVPKDLKGKPGDIMIAMETLRTLGLNPIAGLQGVYIVNARVSVYGEWWLGLIQGSAVYNGHTEEWDDEEKRATVTMYRKGVDTPFVGTFSWAEAEKGKLTDKQTYKDYPRDMLTWRARHRAGSAGFSDVLHGILPSQIADDFPSPEGDRPVLAMPERKSGKAEKDDIWPAGAERAAIVADAVKAQEAPPSPVEALAPASSPAPVQAAAPGPQGGLFAPEARTSGPETHTVKKAVPVSLPHKGSTGYQITFGNEKTFKTKDVVVYRAAAAAEEGKYPVIAMFTGDTVTLIKKA